MEDFKYVDIFATKGIEYIAVLAFLGTLIIFWWLLNKPKVEAKKEIDIEKIKTTLIDWFYLANNFLYHQGHSWAMPENQEIVRVGMDDFSQKLIGRPDKFSLPEKGSEIKQGETAWNIHFNDKTISMLSPVNGKVIDVNEKILKNPDLVNEDPYQEGWLIKVKPSKLSVDIKNLLSGSLAKVWMEDTVNNISSKISGNYGIVLQDGGTIKNGFVRELENERWDELARKFLLTSEN